MNGAHSLTLIVEDVFLCPCVDILAQIFIAVHWCSATVDGLYELQARSSPTFFEVVFDIQVEQPEFLPPGRFILATVELHHVGELEARRLLV